MRYFALGLIFYLAMSALGGVFGVDLGKKDKQLHNQQRQRPQQPSSSSSSSGSTVSGELDADGFPVLREVEVVAEPTLVMPQVHSVRVLFCMS